MKKIFTFLAVVFTTYNLSAQTVVIGNMENWQTYFAGFLPPKQLEKTTGWHCPDSIAVTFGPIIMQGQSFQQQLFKTTDKHSGNFAAKLITLEQGSLGPVPGILTNADILLDTSSQSLITFSGGYPVSLRYNYVNAWVKYEPINSDQAQIVAEAVLVGKGSMGDSVVGTGTVSIDATSGYEGISLPIVYNDPNVVPDHIRVIFSSSTQPVDSSTLYIDDVSLDLFQVNVPKINLNSELVKVYPNPATSTLNISTSYNQNLNFDAFTLNGQAIATKRFKAKAQLDLSNLSSGLYFYAVTDDEKNIIQKGKFSIAR